MLASKHPDKAVLPAAQLESASLYATTRGLRSVPYIVLSNSGMTEAGALHLSYILEIHHVPERLLTRVPNAKAGAPTQQLVSYNESQCRGIIYLPNPLLGSAGHKVLELAEVMRDGYSNYALEGFRESPNAPTMSTENLPRAVSGLEGGACDRRRRSAASLGLRDPNERGDFMESELDRARVRIQGTTLQVAGPQSNDLWLAAFRMLSLGRDIRPQTRNEPRPGPLTPKPKAPIVKTVRPPASTHKKFKPLAPLTPLTSQRDPNQPISPWATQFPKKSGPLPSAPMIIPQTPLTPRLPVLSSLSPPLPKETPGYRTKLPCGFPEHVWRAIMGLAVGAEGIMSESQQRCVLQWAMDRKTLRQESELLGLRASAQCWKILEATGCLAYEMDKP